MAESDSGLNAIAEKAREIIVSPTHEELATVVNHLFMRQESEEHQTARALYDYWVSDFPNCLTLKLLEVYQCSSNGVTRFQSIYLLSETLNEFGNRNFNLSRVALHEIKPLVISCLKKQETEESDIKIFRRIVYFVAYDVVMLYNDNWEELSDCIFLLAYQEPFKAFHIFIDLPPVYYEFIDRFMNKLLEEAENVFLNPEQSGVKDWSLALATVVKMWFQLLNTDISFEVIRSLMGTQLSSVVDSVKELVKNRKEQFLVRGLEDFERFFSLDLNLYDYDKEQCHFVSALMVKIEGVGTQKTKEIVRKIKMLVTNEPKDDVKNHGGEEFERCWLDYLMNLSSPEILRISALTDLEDTSREIAIRWLEVLLSNHTSLTMQIDISEIRELQPLLITYLNDERVSESMFVVLGRVVDHVALEMVYNQGVEWDDLGDYIASQSKTEFQRAVYIFQCLTMPLEDEEFVIHVLANLLPEINSRLNPPRELLVDNSYWFLAFTGAFCAAINLIEIPNHTESAKEITHKMIESVRELVERRMEVGLVRRAFGDLKTIVKKQLEWYGTSEYKFVKGLLWRLYAIKGMNWESKVVLWRINVIVERGVNKDVKELPEGDFDWLNLPEA